VHHECVWGLRGIGSKTPLVLNVDSRRRRVVNFTPRQPRFDTNRRYGGMPVVCSSEHRRGKCHTKGCSTAGRTGHSVFRKAHKSPGKEILNCGMLHGLLIFAECL